MGSVEGLYGEDDISLGHDKILKGFHFLAVEEVHKLGVCGIQCKDYVELQVRWNHGTISLIKL
jgi:hypothetical protein